MGSSGRRPGFAGTSSGRGGGVGLSGGVLGWFWPVLGYISLHTSINWARIFARQALECATDMPRPGKANWRRADLRCISIRKACNPGNETRDVALSKAN